MAFDDESIIGGAVVREFVPMPDAVDELALEYGLSITPNPARESMIISAEKVSPIRYQIYDNLGQQVQSGIVNSNGTSVLINNFNSGIYWVQVTFENGQVAGQHLVVIR